MPTIKFAATKTVDQLDLQALHRVCERLLSQRAPALSIRSAPFCWRAVPACDKV